MNIYDFKVKNSFGEDVSMSDYKGKVLVIVNTATNCGFAPQLDGLQNLYEEYGNEKFEILAFPSNQFASQEPRSNEEIKTFCTLNFGVTYPIFEKIDVNGDNADPLFEFLKDSTPGLLGKAVKWNFTKFLVDSEGKVVERFAPTIKPEKMSDKIKKLIDKIN